MSYWHEKKLEDISFSDDGKEMHIFLEQDDCGAVYASVMVSDVKEALKANKKKHNGNETTQSVG